jgi:hypothetical protein
MVTLFNIIDTKDPKGCSLFSSLTGMGVINLGSSADVSLEDGVKSPDFSLYDHDPTEVALTQLWPMVVCEVAYSERAEKLAYDLGRYVTCSLGRVQLAIGVNIERNRAREGQPQSLTQATCVFWEVEDLDTFAMFKQAGSQPLDHLIRCDGHADMADDRVTPPATKSSCVSLFKGEYFKFVVSQCALYMVIAFVLDCLSVSSLVFGVQIFPEELNGPKEIHILNKHLYRNPKPEDEDKPTIVIPMSEFRYTISLHDTKQSSLENILNKKHGYGGKDSSLVYDEESTDAVVRCIKCHWKKPRME